MPTRPTTSIAGLIQTVAQLADSSGAQLVRPRHEGGVWSWTTEPL
ncbi:hypothetical protein [Actinomadura madurae]|nr:hypothetical protein [Actinomadura madurae]